MKIEFKGGSSGEENRRGTRAGGYNKAMERRLLHAAGLIAGLLSLRYYVKRRTSRSELGSKRTLTRMRGELGPRLFYCGRTGSDRSVLLSTRPDPPRRFALRSKTMRRPYRYVLAATVGALIIMGVQLLGLGPGATTSAKPSYRTAPSGFSVLAVYNHSSASVLEVSASRSAAANAQDDYYGSGFVVDKHRHVLTNYHVIAKARRVYVTLPNQHRLVARIIGKDPSVDLAVLSISGSESLGRPLKFGDSRKLREGYPVIAIGNPLGLSRSISTGVVSSLNRELPAPNKYMISDVIEFDISIDHGSSGGPLFNAKGEVVGITNAIAAEGSQFGFAISSRTIQKTLPQLLAGSKARHARMGVKILGITPALAGSLNLPATGVLVVSVAPRGPAAKAGLLGGEKKASVSGRNYITGGDLIVAVDGQTIALPADLSSIISSHKPGDTITLRFWRNSRIHTLSLRLGNQP